MGKPISIDAGKRVVTPAVEADTAHVVLGRVDFVGKQADVVVLRGIMVGGQFKATTKPVGFELSGADWDLYLGAPGDGGLPLAEHLEDQLVKAAQARGLI